MTPVTEYSFSDESLEWELQLTIPDMRRVPRYILLKRVWITYDKLKDLQDTLGRTLNSSDIVSMMNGSVGGGSYVRTILPSEVGDFSKIDAVGGDILSRYNNVGGLNKPLTGYYFYLDHSISEGFMNYELMAKTISSIQAAYKSHTGGYSAQSGSSGIYTPVNTSVYSTYPVRLVVGERQVVGCKAGDVIRHSTVGGSGEYEVDIQDPLGLIHYFDGSIRVVKNVSGSATVKVSDSNGDEDDFSSVTVTVERIE